MSKGFFKMVFPQWQGIGLKGPFRGANLIDECYLSDHDWTTVPILEGGDLRLEKGIIAYREILEQLGSVTNILKESRPERIMTIGGDCGIELGPVSYLNKKYDGDLALIWFDAHGDLNTPASSPSQRFHGMPVRCLLGEGDSQIVKKCFSRLECSQVILAGTRDLDPPEVRFIDEAGIDVVEVSRLETGGTDIARLIRTKGFTNVHLHVDLDVLDSAIFPHVTCPVPGGLDMKHLLDAVRDLALEFNVVGLSMLEFAPQNRQAASDIVEVMDFMRLLSEARLKKVSRAS